MLIKPRFVAFLSVLAMSALCLQSGHAQEMDQRRAARLAFAKNVSKAIHQVLPASNQAKLNPYGDATIMLNRKTPSFEDTPYDLKAISCEENIALDYSGFGGLNFPPGRLNVSLCKDKNEPIALAMKANKFVDSVLEERKKSGLQRPGDDPFKVLSYQKTNLASGDYLIYFPAFVSYIFFPTVIVANDNAESALIVQMMPEFFCTPIQTEFCEKPVDGLKQIAVSISKQLSEQK